MTESAEQPSDKNHGAVIKRITVDDIMKQYNYDSIDIEGYEKELFESNIDNWLKNTKCLIIELHDRMKHGCSTSFLVQLANTIFHLWMKVKI
jgi:hypothetical protein